MIENKVSDINTYTEHIDETVGHAEAPSRPYHHVCVLLSGGIDSLSCVGYYISRGYDVHALFIDYGQPNADEEEAAATAISKHYGIELRQVRVTGPEVSAGYIPARNAVLLALALMSASVDTGLLAIGIHAGTPYIDCSPLFVRSMQRIIDLYTDGCLRIDAPFMSWTKSEICDYAQNQGIPIHLAFSSNPDDLPSTISLRPHEE